MNEEKELNKLNKKMTEEYLSIVNPILNHPEFQKRKTYNHHENRSVYTHCLMVSIKSYEIAKKLKLDYRSAAIGGLLHDFYYNDWQLNRNVKKPFFKKHGFVHAKEAYLNANKYFPNLMNKKINNIIIRHMWPLNLTPPLYPEGWIVTLVDKYVSLEVFKTPKELYKYVGIRKKVKK